MRPLVKKIAPAAILAGTFFFSIPNGVAKPEYSRKTKKECSFCHPAGSFNLNAAGEYYRDHKYSLQGFVPPPVKPETNQGKN